MWPAARDLGQAKLIDQSPSPLLPDRADGFIHFSTAEQAPVTAAKWFAGREDLILAAVDAEALGEDLRWEPSRGGALFPHLYAALPMSAVVWSRPLPLGPDGRHVFGSLEA